MSPIVNQSINPWYVTGITDGDGCFTVSVSRNPKKSVTVKPSDTSYWRIELLFILTAEINPANLAMLESIKEYFYKLGCSGRLYKDKNVYRLKYVGFKNSSIIREHFIKYPLFTYKLVHFTVWSNILDIILAKRHLTEAGLNEIIKWKSYFKGGLSSLLASSFPNYISMQEDTPLEAPEYKPNFSLMNIHWIGGFINADGGFYLGHRVTGSKLGQIIIQIHIVQDGISRIVLDEIKEFFKLGSVRTKSGTAYQYVIEALPDINIFIDHFSKTQLLGAKALDYRDFCLGIDIINKKEHKTLSGMTKIHSLIGNLNAKRTKFE